MPVYMYKAKTIDGMNVKGTLEANDPATVFSMLKEKGYYPIQVAEQSILQKDISFDFMEKVKLKDMAVFCRQFATIINAGISVLGCLDILRQQTENKKLKNTVEKIYESVQKGNTLSSSMKEHKVFPSILLSMVEAGEVSGSLDVALERMAVHFEKENKINQKVKGAMTYPIIVAIIATIVIAILITFVVPNFVGMFAGMGMELPATTKALLAISNFVKKFWYVIIGVIIGLAILFRYFASTTAGKNIIDGIKLKLPVFGPVNQKVVSSRFTRTLSTLLASGLPLLTSLEIVEKVVDNDVVAKGLEKAKQEVSRGVSLAQPIAQIGIFPPMVIHMLKIGENTGALESILAKTADFYDDEVETAITQMTTMLEPLIIVIMAIVVGFIILSVVQPMFGMFQGLGSM
ncbi:MAG: type pilus assembly protein PilC [Petroclostridium sp.]|jgi:type IV pilus assembly protein PilC|uniref:type II secretion system F family protein n=1 Tax=Petroclostridium xylanilyticum TaxID=1792311 RepID=UPI000B97D594|nr:type II secretion system F family protein [Petroclostridium xylanilyticum]MDK2810834.1 type pilus assembly protein PilC [Petroclostridium sp.]